MADTKVHLTRRGRRRSDKRLASFGSYFTDPTVWIFQSCEAWGWSGQFVSSVPWTRPWRHSSASWRGPPGPCVRCERCRWPWPGPCSGRAALHWTSLCSPLWRTDMGGPCWSWHVTSRHTSHVTHLATSSPGRCNYPSNEDLIVTRLLPVTGARHLIKRNFLLKMKIFQYNNPTPEMERNLLYRNWDCQTRKQQSGHTQQSWYLAILGGSLLPAQHCCNYN